VLECGSVDGGFEHNSLFMLFGITVHLTDLGFENIDKVMSAIFAYLKLLKQCGPNEELFAELQQIEATSFRYQNEKTALDNVEDLVVNMHYFPPQHIITGPQLYFEFDTTAINTVINLLNVPAFNLMVTTSKPYKDVVYDKKEKWFGTEYTTTSEYFLFHIFTD
jgi:nardilysin